MLTKNNSSGYAYYSQRNNKWQPISSCNGTSMIMFDIYNGLLTFDNNGSPISMIGTKVAELLDSSNKFINKHLSKSGRVLNDIYKNGTNHLIYNLDSVAAVDESISSGSTIPNYPINMVKSKGIASSEMHELRLTQVEDNFIYFCQHNKYVLSYYRYMYPELYSEWLEDRSTKLDVSLSKSELTLKSDLAYIPGEEIVTYRNSYPPNELHYILSFANNLWLNYEYIVDKVFHGEICNSKGIADLYKVVASAYATYKMLSIGDIIDRIYQGESMVCSAKLGSLNHMIALVGLQYELLHEDIVNDSSVNIKPINVIIDDPWGHIPEDISSELSEVSKSREPDRYSRIIDYINGRSASGNDSVLTYEKFRECIKPLDYLDSKYMHSLVI